MYVIPEIETEGFTEHTMALLEEYYKNPRIGTLGLTKSELAAISANLPSSDCELTFTDLGSDLVAISHFALIVRSDAATSEELAFLWGFCSEAEEAAKTVISIGDTGIPLALKSKIHIFSNFEMLIPKLKYLLLDALHKNKKDKAFSKTLATTIQILCTIRSRPGVTTKQLAEKFEISPRSAQRYIETLRVAGEWIEYDAKTRGWRLGCGGKSILWDDFDDEFTEETP